MIYKCKNCTNISEETRDGWIKCYCPLEEKRRPPQKGEKCEFYSKIKIVSSR